MGKGINKYVLGFNLIGYIFNLSNGLFNDFFWVLLINLLDAYKDSKDFFKPSPLLLFTYLFGLFQSFVFDLILKIIAMD